MKPLRSLLPSLFIRQTAWAFGGRCRRALSSTNPEEAQDLVHCSCSPPSSRDIEEFVFCHGLSGVRTTFGLIALESGSDDPDAIADWS